MREKEQISRFSDAPWMQKIDHVLTVGGAGGIGSWLLLFLSRASFYKEIYLYEMDTIDQTNLAGQFFHKGQIGLMKSDAIRNNMEMFSNYSSMNILGKFEPGSMVSPICLCGFDNMKARRDMFNAWKELPDRELYIDGRLLMEDGQVYAVTKGKEKQYEATLFDDSELADAKCSMKATTHSGAHIASIMMAVLTNYLSNAYYYHDYVREVPFSYIFSFVPMLIEVDV